MGGTTGTTPSHHPPAALTAPGPPRHGRAGGGGVGRPDRTGAFHHRRALAVGRGGQTSLETGPLRGNGSPGRAHGRFWGMQTPGRGDGTHTDTHTHGRSGGARSGSGPAGIGPGGAQAPPSPAVGLLATASRVAGGGRGFNAGGVGPRF